MRGEPSSVENLMATVIEGQFPYRILAQNSSSPSSTSNPVDAVIFFGLCLVLGIASRHVLRGTRVPYTVALLVIGIALGSLGLTISIFSLFLHFLNYFEILILTK